ncbi:MAG: hypothetical protein JW749_09645 [Sedimentisphaerales bacterium]|nr:hypothetical protein [Sedimentisphaerales bacterium]
MACADIQNRGTAAPVIVIGFVVFALLICLFVTIAVTWLYCRIFSKAGYNWVLGLGDRPVLRYFLVIKGVIVRTGRFCFIMVTITLSKISQYELFTCFGHLFLEENGGCLP